MQAWFVGDCVNYWDSRVVVKDEDDRQIVRELGVQNTSLPTELATQAVQTSYNISVYTGKVSGAGTDANVYIVLYGVNGDSGVIDLVQSKTHKNKFEKGQVDEFVIKAIDLGDLVKVRIGHDGSGPGAGWNLEKVHA